MEIGNLFPIYQFYRSPSSHRATGSHRLPIGNLAFTCMPVRMPFGRNVSPQTLRRWQTTNGPWNRLYLHYNELLLLLLLLQTIAIAENHLHRFPPVACIAQFENSMNHQPQPRSRMLVNIAATNISCVALALSLSLSICQLLCLCVYVLIYRSV